MPTGFYSSPAKMNIQDEVQSENNEAASFFLRFRHTVGGATSARFFSLISHCNIQRQDRAVPVAGPFDKRLKTTTIKTSRISVRMMRAGGSYSTEEFLRGT